MPVIIMPTRAGLLFFAAIILGGCHPDRPIPQPVMTAGLTPQQPVVQPTAGNPIHRPVQ